MAGVEESSEGEESMETIENDVRQRPREEEGLVRGTLCAGGSPSRLGPLTPS